MTQSTKIQTLIFDKDKFSKSDAIHWAKKHDFKASVDEKENTYRFRQMSPDRFKRDSFRTTDFGGKLPKGIKAVIARPIQSNNKKHPIYNMGGEINNFYNYTEGDIVEIGKLPYKVKSVGINYIDLDMGNNATHSVNDITKVKPLKVQYLDNKEYEKSNEKIKHFYDYTVGDIVEVEKMPYKVKSVNVNDIGIDMGSSTHYIYDINKVKPLRVKSKYRKGGIIESISNFLMQRVTLKELFTI